MKDLQSYISNIDYQLLNQVRGKMGELISAVQEHNFMSEEALMHHIIGSERNPNYYYNLKSKTLKILQALAIVSTSKEGSMVKKKYDLCQKKFLLGQKFIGKGVRNEGIQLIKQAQKIAIEYDFVHLASELSSLLYHHHALFPKKWETAAYYAAAVEKYSNYYLQEKKVEHYFFQVLGCESGALKNKGLKEIIGQLAQVKGETLKCKTYQAMSMVIYGRSINDYQLMIESYSTAH